MIKILHVIHGLNLGGAENFIFNLLSAINHTKYRFDFAIQEPNIKHKQFKELIESTGGKIYVIPDFTKNPIGQYKQLKHLISCGYSYVHIHMNAFINPIPAIAAAASNCKVIIHSHSTQNGRGGLLGKLIHKLNKQLFLKDNFIRLSCSKAASMWMFGNKDSQNISNAVDTNKYIYNESIRNRLRSKHNLSNEYVIGQVGRLIPLKNQAFSIRLLANIIRLHPDINAKLMLVGDGSDKEKLISLARSLKISDNIIFTGNVHNANEYYSVFDSFIMTSLFEGLTYAAIEAQTAGLKSIMSDTISKEVNITDSVDFLSLAKPELWVEQLYLNSLKYDRNIISQKVIGSAFDLNVMVKSMENIYCKSNNLN